MNPVLGLADIVSADSVADAANAVERPFFQAATAILPQPGRRAGAKKLGPGRPQGQTGEATRKRILDNAEALFADGGFDGTSVRDIAAVADVGVAVITHHFGAKENLFELVVARRSAVLNARREQVLAEAFAANGGAPLALETLVRGYVEPFLNSARGDDPHWHNYAVLMGRLANSPRGTAVIHRHAGPIADRYLREFFRALPSAAGIDILAGFLTMVSGMLTFSAATGRLENMATGCNITFSGEEAIESMIRYCVAGFARSATTKPPDAG
jgi:AcrR family transcriptional regulator